MDPFNSINPFDRDFAASNAAAPQPQQRQAEFEPYLAEVLQLDTSGVAEDSVSPDHYYPHLSEEGRRGAEALGLRHQSADGPHPQDAVTRRFGYAAAQHSAPREALTWPQEHDQRGPIVEDILASALNPTAPGHQGPDLGEAVRYFNWSDAYQPAANELTGIAPLSGHDVLISEDYTGQLRPAKRQRTLSETEGGAIERQLSGPGNSVARELTENAGTSFQPSGQLVLPAEDYEQDLLWATMENAGPSSSLAPTERHDQAADSGVAVRSLNSRHSDQRTSVPLEGSSVLPSQDTPPAPFIVHNDRFTALFVPAAAMRGGSPLNLSGAPIHFGSRPENVPQPSAQPANRPSPARLAGTMEQAAPASARAETSPAARKVYAASFAVPEGFSHGTQPAPISMISKLGRWGLLPDAAQPMKQYDIRGERYTALLGPGGPNDVRLIHHP
ncbi:hypothetical protein AOQ72_20750 [Bradyrhizobium yuanmingense]|uniref:Uncharacterized protein n=1 Tax=Bradyrhizobium yuanmingense TaxID=108015 RepID=A0A0R3CCC5_9BRAD|nr:hypothetical protein [Bradyrhizobium yuanmingense]KRP93741.1 hypothetical protein AOQ72_20750 [Bradyrhizobium yuanmingense]